MKAITACLALVAATARAEEPPPAAQPDAAPVVQAAPVDPSAVPPPPAPPPPPPAPPRTAAPPPYPPPPPPPFYAPPPPGPYPSPTHAMPGRRRDTWYIGFGLGSGSGRYTLTDGTQVAFRDHVGGSPLTLSLNFKVGATLTPHLLLGLDITAVRTQSDYQGAYGQDATTGIQVNNYDAMLTWFPTGEGFFLRGGAGLAALVADASAAGATGRATRSGLGVVAGVGYAFWLGRSFNLTLGLDLSGQSYGSGGLGPKSSSAASFLVGFDWY